MKINNIPQEIASKLPVGQIVLLTSTETGITYGHCNLIQFISKMGDFTGNSHIISSITVDEPALWGCFAYRLADGQNQQVLVADKNSLVEMLCNIWGLDLDTLKSQITQKRYRSLLPNGKSHPICITIASTSHSQESMTANGNGQTLVDIGSIEDFDESDYDLSLCFTTPTEASVVRDLTRSINDIIGWNIDFSKEKLNKLFDELMENRREYHVELSCKKEKVKYDSRMEFRLAYCDLYLVDDKENKYKIEDIGIPRKKVGPSEKAAYLAFLFFKDGVRLDGFQIDQKFMDIYNKIYASMPDKNQTQNAPDTQMFMQKASNINKGIMQAVSNTKVQQQFGVIKKEKGVYAIPVIDDNLKKQVKQIFEL